MRSFERLGFLIVMAMTLGGLAGCGSAGSGQSSNDDSGPAIVTREVKVDATINDENLVIMSAAQEATTLDNNSTHVALYKERDHNVVAVMNAEGPVLLAMIGTDSTQKVISTKTTAAAMVALNPYVAAYNPQSSLLESLTEVSDLADLIEVNIKSDPNYITAGDTPFMEVYIKACDAALVQLNQQNAATRRGFKTGGVSKKSSAKVINGSVTGDAVLLGSGSGVDVYLQRATSSIESHYTLKLANNYNRYCKAFLEDIAGSVAVSTIASTDLYDAILRLPKTEMLTWQPSRHKTARLKIYGPAVWGSWSDPSDPNIMTRALPPTINTIVQNIIVPVVSEFLPPGLEASNTVKLAAKVTDEILSNAAVRNKLQATAANSQSMSALTNDMFSSLYGTNTFTVSTWSRILGEAATEITEDVIIDRSVKFLTKMLPILKVAALAQVPAEQFYLYTQLAQCKLVETYDVSNASSPIKIIVAKRNGLDITFEATGAYVHEYEWYFESPLTNRVPDSVETITGRSISSMSSTTSSVSHNFTKPGKYLVSVIGKDVDGAESTTEIEVYVNEDRVLAVISSGAIAMTYTIVGHDCGGHAIDQSSSRTYNHGPLFLGYLPLYKVNGAWEPATLTEVRPPSLCFVGGVGEGQGTYVQSLSPAGVVTVTEQGSCPDHPSISSRETIDLETGAYTLHYVVYSSYTVDGCGPAAHTETQDRVGTMGVYLAPP